MKRSHSLCTAILALFVAVGHASPESLESRFEGLKVIPLEKNPYLQPNGMNVLGPGEVRTAVEIPARLMQDYGLRLGTIDSAGLSDYFRLQTPDGDLHADVYIYPSVDEARKNLLWRVAGERSESSLPDDLQIPDVAFARPLRRGHGEVFLVCDNVDIVVAGTTRPAYELARALGALVKHASLWSSAQDPPYLLVTEETFKLVGRLQPICAVNPRRTEGPEPGAVVYFTKPKNAEVFPRGTREVVVEGVVTRDDIHTVIVQATAVPVENNSFRTLVEMTTDSLHLSLTVPEEFNSRRSVNRDGIIVCRDPLLPRAARSTSERR